MRSSEGGNERQEISAMLNMLFFCCLLKYNSKRTLSCFSASTTTHMSQRNMPIFQCTDVHCFAW